MISSEFPRVCKIIVYNIVLCHDIVYRLIRLHEIAFDYGFCKLTECVISKRPTETIAQHRNQHSTLIIRIDLFYSLPSLKL